MGKIILNPGETEFALGLLLVGATRTKTFEGLAFTSPFTNFICFAQIGKKKSLAARLEEERRLMELEVTTIQELQN
jgi:hypothetical protein